VTVQAAPLTDFEYWLPGSSSPSIAGFYGFWTGVGQGGVNVVNGLQDSLIGLANLPAMGVNAIGWTEEKLGWLDSSAAHSISIPYIPSPDWSRDLVTHESGSGWTDSHAWGKGLGAFGVEILGGAEYRVRRLRPVPLAKSCRHSTNFLSVAVFSQRTKQQKLGRFINERPTPILGS
jgi:hypothetical protein